MEILWGREGDEGEGVCMWGRKVGGFYHKSVVGPTQHYSFHAKRLSVLHTLL